MENSQSFGAQLRELRKRASLTLRELAEKVNVNFTYLSKIENSALPPPSEKVIRHLAEALNYDKDELLALAGIIPSDIAEILKDRKARERLRAEQAKRAKSTGLKMPALPRFSLPLKGLYRLALPVFLVIAVATSIWYASPTQALTIDITNPSPGYHGTTHQFTVTINIQEPDLIPIKTITMYIFRNSTYTSANSPNKATLADLPLPYDTATATYTHAQTGGGPATVTIVSSAGVQTGYTTGSTYALWQSTGYQFGSTTGYGYGSGPTYITYTVSWTSPLSWPTGSYKIETQIYASGPSLNKTFTETGSAFTLSVAAVGGWAPPAEEEEVVVTPEPEPGVTDVSDSVDSTGRFTEPVTAVSEDGNIEIDIPEDTVGYTLDEEGTIVPLSEITIEPTDAPTGASTIMVRGEIYDLGPSGAIFEDPITLTFNFDPGELAEGEIPVINYYDVETGAWVPFEGCVVDWETGTVTVDVYHFTAFAVLAQAAVVPEPEPEPAPPAPEPAPEPAPPAPAPEPEPEPAPPAPAPEPEPEPTPPAPAPAPAPEEGVNWWLIGGIIAAVIIVAIVVWLLVLRRRG